jgi:hypothetical protein
MNPLLFPSHHLFVAAVSDDDGRRTKHARNTRAVRSTEAVRVIPLEYADCAPPPRSVEARPFLEPDCRPGW